MNFYVDNSNTRNMISDSTLCRILLDIKTLISLHATHFLTRKVN